MPSGICNSCGKITNSIISDWNWNLGEAVICYASFDQETRLWSKGCAYDNASPFHKEYADHLIETQPHAKPSAPIEDFEDCDEEN